MDELSPFLRDLKRKKGGFKAPEGYFDGLEDAVFQKIDGQGARKAFPMKAVPGGLFYRLTRSRITYAAAAAVALVLASWWFLRPVAPETLMAQNDLTEEELHTYITENASDFELDQLAMLHTDESGTDFLDAPETVPVDSQKRQRVNPAKGFHPEDVNDLLDDMSEEELEEIL